MPSWEFFAAHSDHRTKYIRSWTLVILISFHPCPQNYDCCALIPIFNSKFDFYSIISEFY